MRYSTIFILFIASLLPAAAALAETTGAVRIFTTPGDAEISVDGERSGNSPVSPEETFLIRLAPGEHQISVTKAGYGKAERKLFVAAGTDQTVKLDLVPGIAMVAIPGGCFQMGTPPDEPERDRDEGPQHEVCVAPFAIGKYEVTFADWDACTADGGCTHRPNDEGWGRGKRPVINVSWHQIQEYIRWLNITGTGFRLPTEAEWEYATRAGTTTPFSTGDCITTDQANYDGTFEYAQCGVPTGPILGKTAEVGSYPPNPWGLHDVHGNINELVEDCWHDSYDGAPHDGSAWVEDNCPRRVVRGGSWYGFVDSTRSGYHCRAAPTFGHRSIGFRLARTPILTP